MERDEGTGTETLSNRSEAEFHHRLIEYSTDLIAVLGADGTIEFVNPTVEDVLEYKPDDVLGKNALEWVHPEDCDRVSENFQQRVDQSTQPTEVEFRYQTANGEYIWLQTRGQNCLDDPVIEGIVLVSREVTERKRRREAVEALHDRTRDLFTAETRADIAELTATTAKEVLQHSITVVRLLSPDGTRLEPVAVTNDAIESLGERPTYRVGEKTAGRAFAENQTKRYQDLANLEDDYDRGEVRSGLFVPMEDHGVLAIGEIEVDAFEEEDRQIAEILATNAEAAFDRLERQQQLQRQNEHLEDVASVISHELRGPLNVATGRLELLESDSEHVEPLEDALGRIEDLIDDVLTLAREGRTVNTTEQVDLEPIVREAWGNVVTHSATLQVETEKTIRADPSRLPEIFENLFRNAVEHGGPEVTITVGDHPEGFYIADDGQGIPPESRAEVFEAGYTTSEGGTGFGLYIVEEIVEAHGWNITVTDSVDGGARFEFTGVVTVQS